MSVSRRPRHSDGVLRGLSIELARAQPHHGARRFDPARLRRSDLRSALTQDRDGALELLGGAGGALHGDLLAEAAQREDELSRQRARVEVRDDGFHRITGRKVFKEAQHQRVERGQPADVHAGDQHQEDERIAGLVFGGAAEDRSQLARDFFIELHDSELAMSFRRWRTAGIFSAFAKPASPPSNRRWPSSSLTAPSSIARWSASMISV